MISCAPPRRTKSLAPTSVHDRPVPVIAFGQATGESSPLLPDPRFLWRWLIRFFLSKTENSQLDTLCSHVTSSELEKALRDELESLKRARDKELRARLAALLARGRGSCRYNDAIEAICDVYAEFAKAMLDACLKAKLTGGAISGYMNGHIDRYVKRHSEELLLDRRKFKSRNKLSALNDQTRAHFALTHHVHELLWNRIEAERRMKSLLGTTADTPIEQPSSKPPMMAVIVNNSAANYEHKINNKRSFNGSPQMSATMGDSATTTTCGGRHCSDAETDTDE